jgi:drug/metabolite transporter (DMT)-like permease
MKAGFITGLYTVTVPIFGFLFLKKKTPSTVWVGAAVALVGLYLLCSVSGESLHITDLLLFLTVPIWSVHILLVDAKSRKIDPFAFSCVQYTVCGTLSLIGAILLERSSMQPEAIGQAIIPILYGGILSVGIAYTLQIIAQKNSDPTVAAIIFSTESVFCCIGNLIFFKVDMTFTQYIGCALIFAGIVISQLVLKNKKVKTDP